MSNFEGESLGSWLKVNDPRTETLRSFLESILGKHPLFADENKTRACIAAMNCGTYQIQSEVVIDYYTTNSDFSADVMSRAQFYSENLF